MRERLRKGPGYVVRKKRLTKNPISKANLPEDWTPRRPPMTPSIRAPSESPPAKPQVKADKPALMQSAPAGFEAALTAPGSLPI